MRITGLFMSSLLFIVLLFQPVCAAPSPIEKGPRLQEDLRRMREGLERREQRFEDRVRIERDLVYGTDQPDRQNLDLYVPKNADSPLPLVVWIHGGGWKWGDKSNTPALFLLEKGFAVASINYRLTTTDTYPAQIHDCKAAIRYLRANADKFLIDPNQIGAWGSSAGGHLAALLGTTNGNEYLEGSVGDYPDVSSDIQAVCDWCGPTDFLNMPIRPGLFKPEEDPELFLLGGRAAEKKELAELASPYFHADQADVPFLIMHGNQDEVVPPEQSRKLHEKLKSAGVDSTLIVLEGKGHSLKRNPDVFEPVGTFFKRTLKEEPPAEDDSQT